MSIEKEFVPYEEALALKELGFDEPCLAVYFNPTKALYFDKYINEFNKDVRTLAPLFSQAFRWFRESYSYNCFIVSTNTDKWFYFREDLNDLKNDSEPELTPKFDTYEEAELDCLRKLIEIQGGNQ